MTTTPRTVRCPQCGQPAEYSAQNPCRPFCSERCRLIDLGDWAEGKYALPTDPSQMTPEEREQFDAELERELARAAGAPEESLDEDS